MTPWAITRSQQYVWKKRGSEIPKKLQYKIYEQLTYLNRNESVIFLGNDCFPVDGVHVAEVRVLFDPDSASQDVGQAWQANLLHTFHLANYQGIVLKRKKIG